VTTTAYSTANAAFSQSAHVAAAAQFYPQMWPGNTLKFYNCTGRDLDLQHGIDRVAEVSLPDPQARGPVRFYIQERFRRPDCHGFRDITITEWNLGTDQPSELHKLGAQLFVYGFFNEHTRKIEGAIAVDVCRLQSANVTGTLKYTREKHGAGDQSFIGVQWDHLHDLGAVMFSTMPPDPLALFR